MIIKIGIICGGFILMFMICFASYIKYQMLKDSYDLLKKKKGETSDQDS